MKRFILAAVAAVALTTSASAYDLNITFAPYQYFSGPRVLHIPEPLGEAERNAKAEEDTKWAAFCQPVREVTDLGVTHLRYAHRGCEFGRSQ